METPYRQFITTCKEKFERLGNDPEARRIGPLVMKILQTHHDWPNLTDQEKMAAQVRGIEGHLRANSHFTVADTIADIIQDFRAGPNKPHRRPA